LINDAKSYHYHKEELSDLELLLELQHYGAATGYKHSFLGKNTIIAFKVAVYKL
jgi:hypothetical protein